MGRELEGRRPPGRLGGDSAGARSFTLLHELAHLWLREPGVSAGDPTDPVEVYCNRVASSFLLPQNELDREDRLEASGSLTATKVGKVLGVNPRNAHAILPAG